MFMLANYTPLSNMPAVKLGLMTLMVTRTWWTAIHTMYPTLYTQQANMVWPLQT